LPFSLPAQTPRERHLILKEKFDMNLKQKTTPGPSLSGGELRETEISFAHSSSAGV
jgi:ABC-type lipopolysaccharide export system ATPase subunit